MTKLCYLHNRKKKTVSCQPFYNRNSELEKTVIRKISTKNSLIKIVAIGTTADPMPISLQWHLANYKLQCNCFFRSADRQNKFSVFI